MIYKIGQIYRDTTKPSNPDDQFSGWITPPNGPSIRLVGGIRSQAFAHTPEETIAPANMYLISALTETAFDKPWVNVVDYKSATVEYWGDAKPDDKKKIDYFQGNRALRRALEGKVSDGIGPPFLLFSRVGPGQLRFECLCVLDAVEAKEVRSESGEPYQNYLARLTILDVTEVSAEWLRDRVMHGPDAGESTACPKAWRDLKSGNVQKINSAIALELNPALVSVMNMKTGAHGATPSMLNGQPAYFMTWNRKTWPWEELVSDVAAVRSGKALRTGTGATRWSCSNNKQIKQGSRFFMLKQGTEPKGVVASGWITSDSYEDSHWDPNRSANGDTTRYVDLFYDALLNPDNEPPLDVSVFNTPPLSDVNWLAYKSGISVEPNEAVPAIESAWEEHLCGLGIKMLPSPFAGSSKMLLVFHAGIPEGITRADILQAIADLDLGISHNFGPSTTYDLVHDGKRFPPKAVIGLAARRILGHPLKHSEFEGGLQTQCFKILENLGFEIVPKKISAQRGPRWWVLSAGKGGSLWNEFQEHGIAAISYGSHADLRAYADRQSIIDDLRNRNGPDTPEPINDSLALWQFANEIAIGDIIVAKIGQLRLLGVGVVESNYYFDMRRDNYRHVHDVRWTHSFNLVLPKELAVALKALTEITDFPQVVTFIKDAMFADTQEVEAVVSAPFSVDDAMANLFMPRSMLESMLSTWKRKRNLLLQGPPGVGKTFVARTLAYALMEAKDKKRLEMIQFHQSYSYEDFVQGFRPAPKGEFELRNGVFYEFCNRARMDASKKPYIFIIDEINRGNLSRIFGELLMLIEPDKRGPDFAIPLTYSDPDGERFSIPENLYLLGMMNTADRSLALVDYALRRRFAFISLDSQFESEAFKKHLAGNGATEELIQKLIGRMVELNTTIREDHKNLGPGFVIGHSYFCPVPGAVLDNAWYTTIIETEIAPLVREYWCDGRDKAEKLIAALLKP